MPRLVFKMMVEEQQHPPRSQGSEMNLETAEWCVYCRGWLKDLCFILLFAVIIMQGHSMLSTQHKEANMTSVLVSTQYEILERLSPVDSRNDHAVSPSEDPLCRSNRPCTSTINPNSNSDSNEKKRKK